MVEPSQQMGVRVCLKCGWHFVSRDRIRLRRCLDCKNSEDDYQVRCGRVAVTSEAIRLVLRE